MIEPWVWGVNQIGIPLLVLTLLVVLVMVVFPAWVVLKLAGFSRRLITGKETIPERLPERVASPRQTSQGMAWLLLILVFAFIFWTYAPKKRGPGVRQPPPRPTAYPTWVIPVVVGSLAIAFVGFTFLRHYDPVLIRAGKQRQAQDIEGAIATLREAVESRPTASRANDLACYLMAKEAWTEAYKQLLEAKRLGLDENFYRMNVAHVLRNMGRPEEAMAVLEPHVHSPKASIIEICHWANCLIDLGRLDEALEQIGRAESIFKNPPFIMLGSFEGLRKLIDDCRARYQDRLGKKKEPLFDDL